MAANGLKMEPSLVKGEPGSDDLDMADIDEVGGYEDDTGELIIPKNIPEGWLLRVPKELWTLLQKVDDDTEIQLGEVRIWDNKDPKATEKQTIRLDLNPSIPGKDLSLVPKAYDLTSTQGAQAGPTKNTFVFSEKNLPGFRPRSNFKQDPLHPQGASKVEKPRGPRTIPKRTEYLCTATKELVCTPRDNAEYRRIAAAKRALATGATKITTFISDESAARALQNQGMQISLDDSNFINPPANNAAGGGMLRTKHKTGQENKATRMPEFELIDALQQLFREYKFWPMSALKKRLRQPEAWLKEVLGKIAILVRTGQAANHYMLRPENEGIGEYGDVGEAVKSEEVAPEVKEEELGSEDDDDEDMFEDV